MNKNLIDYLEERVDAANTLYETVRRFRDRLDGMNECEKPVDAETAAILQAYVPAQLALLQLMKEESEEN